MKKIIVGIFSMIMILNLVSCGTKKHKSGREYVNPEKFEQANFEINDFDYEPDKKIYPIEYFGNWIDYDRNKHDHDGGKIYYKINACVLARVSKIEEKIILIDVNNENKRIIALSKPKNTKLKENFSSFKVGDYILIELDKIYIDFKDQTYTIYALTMEKE